MLQILWLKTIWNLFQLYIFPIISHQKLGSRCQILWFRIRIKWIPQQWCDRQIEKAAPPRLSSASPKQAHPRGSYGSHSSRTSNMLKYAFPTASYPQLLVGSDPISFPVRRFRKSGLKISTNKQILEKSDWAISSFFFKDPNGSEIQRRRYYEIGL